MTSTPSGSASAAHSSTELKLTFSRASASTSEAISASRVPACANPVRPSLMIRIPIPDDIAETKCSTSPLWTRTSVLEPREMYTSICSPPVAVSMSESASAKSSSLLSVVLTPQSHQSSLMRLVRSAVRCRQALLGHLYRTCPVRPSQSRCRACQYRSTPADHCR